MEKKKEKKPFLYKPHQLGGKVNPLNSYAIRFVDSLKIIEKYRNKATAINDLPKFKKIFKKELEIVSL